MKALIVANGKFRIADVLQHQKMGYYIVACDGAADKLLKAKIIFDFVVGDMDSVSKKTFQHIKNHCKYLIKESQDITDLEFAINVCKDFASEILILGGIQGYRLDHLLMNMLLLKKTYSNKVPIFLYDTRQLLFFAQNQTIKFESIIDSNIGFFGFSSAKLTCVSNIHRSPKALEWELQNYVLNLEKSTSAANIIKSSSFTLKIEGDCIIALPKESKYYFLK